MSGHSKWSTIKHKKANLDSKRAKIFTKIIKEIIVAAKIGDSNADFNPRLRSAIISAKSVNLPKERIENAIKKGQSKDVENYDEMRYEGYASGGIAIIVEALTDNKNRTASGVRSAFTKFGGNLGETGSLSFMFNKVGIINYLTDKISEDEIFEKSIDLGCESFENYGEVFEIVTSLENFHSIRDELSKVFGDPEDSKIIWKANDYIQIDDIDKAKKIEALVDKLEDDDDVQAVFGNFEFSENVINLMNK